MLRNRTFLAGLGIGIIVGALLLQLMFIGEQNVLSTNNSLNKDNELKYSQIDVDTMIAAERASAELNASVETETQEKVAEEAPTQTEAPKETPSNQNDEAVKEKNEEEPKPVETVPPTKQIQIKGGMNVTNTAALLADNDLITDQSAFISKMKKSKKKIRAGHFIITGQPTIEEIITIITSPPLTKN